MNKFIQDHQDRGREMLLMLDANEEIGTKSQGITALVQECSLVYNILSIAHPDSQTPITFDRGSKTIDYILGSQICKEALLRAGGLPFYQRIQAEHRASIYADFDANILFGGSQQAIAPAKHQAFQSTKQEEVMK